MKKSLLSIIGGAALSLVGVATLVPSSLELVKDPGVARSITDTSHTLTQEDQERITPYKTKAPYGGLATGAGTVLTIGGAVYALRNQSSRE